MAQTQIPSNPNSCCIIQGVQLKSGPSTKLWIFHVRCYL